jgi:hypothetical protein
MKHIIKTQENSTTPAFQCAEDGEIERKRGKTSSALSYKKLSRSFPICWFKLAKEEEEDSHHGALKGCPRTMNDVKACLVKGSASTCEDQ